ncbi:chromate efflux transporter [Rhodanobacter denitrificans]|uniref:Chromate transporter, chromate ion transporter family n=1 Tax=Rhodanobacter denitrificans TaxID=666685 RepID=M4NFQ7_9GAMM|nr:chromate efflux transporter [Rhodanobacter denitrificans]AGG88453.1 chromate transporter, chromate ion transporter family [Rhodanobacter denitrificans]UJJ58877.1 chromate efflux transporter [Rhodanobacter denitrificans]UJM87590.1 chromate efflux transporter [Rhodanobacter denitrificans]
MTVLPNNAITGMPEAEDAGSMHRVSLAQATRVWAKIGWLSFGGPAGQIAVMHRELVEQRRWISEPRFLHALNYCMLLPGPEAAQLAIYIGWLLHRTAGGLVAGCLFVLPGVLVLSGLSVLYAFVGQVAMVVAVFFGLKAAVLAVVVEAVLRIARRALKGHFFVGVAFAAFLAIHVLRLPFPLIIAGAAVLGIVARRWRPRWFPVEATAAELAGDGYLVDQLMLRGELAHTKPSRTRALRAVGIGLALWAAPVLAVVILFGHTSVLAREGLLFSETAVVTFGGAYAVLAYVAQRVVTDYGWLSPAQMLDGLALAETTPGPLIMVVQFVAFMAAFQHQPGMSPWLAGMLGSLLTVWVIFVPCFLFIFLGGPYIETLRGNRVLNSALSAVTAAVVGVVLNLSVWFAEHTIFGVVRTLNAGPVHLDLPQLSTLNPAALVLAAGAMVAMLRYRAGMAWTLGVCGCLGAALRLIQG